MADIETRLAALERANKRYKLALGGVCAVLAGLVLTGFGGQIPEKLQAKEFELVNKDGKVLARIGHLDGLGAVTTYTPSGQILVDLVPTQSGAGGIVMYNGKGAQTMVMTDVSGGGGSLLINNAKGDKVLSLGRNTSQGGSITSYNQKGKTSVLITNDTADAGTVLTYDDANKETSRTPK